MSGIAVFPVLAIATQRLFAILLRPGRQPPSDMRLAPNRRGAS